MTISTQSSAGRAGIPAANAVRALIGNRRGLLVLGAVALGLGLVFKWNWVVAAGFAPFILAVLPCAAMCALGLCMNEMAGGSGNAQPPSSDTGSDSPASLPLVTHSTASSEIQAASGVSAEPARAADKSCCHR